MGKGIPQSEIKSDIVLNKMGMGVASDTVAIGQPLPLSNCSCTRRQVKGVERHFPLSINSIVDMYHAANHVGSSKIPDHTCTCVVFQPG